MPFSKSTITNPAGKGSSHLARMEKLLRQGLYPAAAKMLAVALRKNPGDPGLLLISAKIDYANQQFDSALRTLSQLTQQQPDSADVYHLLGSILSQTGQTDAARHAAAVNAMERAHQLAPDDPQICTNLAGLILRQGNFNAAEPLLLKAKKLDPAGADTRNNLGVLYREQLRHEEAVQEYRQAVALRPDLIQFRYHLVRSLGCCPHTDPRDDFEVFQAMGECIEKNTSQPFKAYSKPRDKIRIAYLGSTLREHSVAYFLLPVIAHHSDQFEVFCYHIGGPEDHVTRLIADKADCYRHLAGQSPESIARQIHKDSVNILIELDGYTDLSGLRVLAHAPAPVQMSWIGYPDTSGMSRIGYRIVDHFTDPVDGIADSVHTEKLIRMPASFSVYSAPADAPDVNATPALSAGYVTFGSFNVPMKMNAELIEVWARILKAVPDSRLLLKNASFQKESMQENIVAAFRVQGVPAERLVLKGPDMTKEAHLRRYHEMDIALDPFPYNGTTTSCEALWMGVPVITLAGEKHVSRVGVSQLNNIGCPDWIAADIDHYVEIAVKLASDSEKLNATRITLRETMSSSPLMDGKTFAAEFEQKLVAIWRDHCA